MDCGISLFVQLNTARLIPNFVDLLLVVYLSVRLQRSGQPARRIVCKPKEKRCLLNRGNKSACCSGPCCHVGSLHHCVHQSQTIENMTSIALLVISLAMWALPDWVFQDQHNVYNVYGFKKKSQSWSFYHWSLITMPVASECMLKQLKHFQPRPNECWDVTNQLNPCDKPRPILMRKRITFSITIVTCQDNFSAVRQQPC